MNTLYRREELDEVKETASQIINMLDELISKMDATKGMITVESIIFSIFDTYCLKYGKDPVEEKKMICRISEKVKKAVQNKFAH